MRSEYATENLSSSNNNLYIYTDSQAAIKAIIGQSRDSYHKNTIRKIRENLMSICQMVDETKSVYCPAHEGIRDNGTADSLTKVASKKAKHLPKRPEILLAEISKANKHLTLRKQQKRWEN